MQLAKPHLTLSQTPGRQARALRAIGQALSELSPTDLVIEKHSEVYRVRGRCPRQRLEREAQPNVVAEKPSLFNKLFGRGNVSPEQNAAKSQIVEFDRDYGPQDIDRLDEAGIKRRTGMNRILDARGLPEMLRTVGRLMDGGNFTLKRLKKFPDRIAVEYLDPTGAAFNEQLTVRVLIELHTGYFKSRGMLKIIDVWSGLGRAK